MVIIMMKIRGAMPTNMAMLSMTVMTTCFLMYRMMEPTPSGSTNVPPTWIKWPLNILQNCQNGLCDTFWAPGRCLSGSDVLHIYRLEALACPKPTTLASVWYTWTS